MCMYVQSCMYVCMCYVSDYRRLGVQQSDRIHQAYQCRTKSHHAKLPRLFAVPGKATNCMYVLYVCMSLPMYVWAGCILSAKCAHSTAENIFESCCGEPGAPIRIRLVSVHSVCMYVCMYVCKCVCVLIQNGSLALSLES